MRLLWQALLVLLARHRIGHLVAVRIVRRTRPENYPARKRGHRLMEHKAHSAMTSPAAKQERFTQRGGAMLSTHEGQPPFRPAGDWVKAADYDALTERLSLSQQDRHTLEVDCRDLRVQNDKLRRALQATPLTAQRISDLAWECVRDMLGDDDDDSERINKLIRAVIGETVTAYRALLDATASPVAQRYTPEQLLEVAKNTLQPKDRFKLNALVDLIDALKRPDQLETATQGGASECAVEAQPKGHKPPPSEIGPYPEGTVRG